MLSEQQPKVPLIDNGTLRENFHHDLEVQGHIPSKAAGGFKLPDMFVVALSLLD